MKKFILSVIAIFLAVFSVSAQKNAAQRRAENLGLGMNLSYLEQYWLGTKEKKFTDFVKPEEVAKREKKFADIAGAGFKTVRIPICFSAWMQMERPYEWINEEGLKAADKFIEWGMKNGLNVIIDLHHTELDRSFPEAENPERIVNLWNRIAFRYKDTDPEKVFFELRNEPNKITAEQWRWQAEQIIKIVRSIAPDHTLIVGFHEWNSRQAMIDSKPFDDDNIIYTFHYYDPFLFTHQAATWTEKGFAEVEPVPFPFDKTKKTKMPKTGRGEWIEKLIDSYKKDSDAEKMFEDLKKAKAWSDKHNVPIFVGEFGSYGKNPTIEDRCRHAEVVYTAFGKLGIPNAWWEWDGGFTMFEKDAGKIADCMQRAIDSYENARGK